MKELFLQYFKLGGHSPGFLVGLLSFGGFERDLDLRIGLESTSMVVAVEAAGCTILCPVCAGFDGDRDVTGVYAVAKYDGF